MRRLRTVDQPIGFRLGWDTDKENVSMKQFLVAALIAASFAAWAASAIAQTVPPNHEAVRQAQRQLNVAGFNPGPENGLLNSDTQDAIRQFQKKQGLPATGELDQTTADKLAQVSGITFPESGSRSQQPITPENQQQSAPKQ